MFIENVVGTHPISFYSWQARRSGKSRQA